MVNLFIVNELDTFSQDLNINFTLKNCLFGSIKLTKNDDPDKYSCSGMELDLILVHIFHDLAMP